MQSACELRPHFILVCEDNELSFGMATAPAGASLCHCLEDVADHLLHRLPEGEWGVAGKRRRQGEEDTFSTQSGTCRYLTVLDRTYINLTVHVPGRT